MNIFINNKKIIIIVYYFPFLWPVWKLKKRRESRVKGGRVIQLPCFGSFLRKEGEEFGGVWRSFNHL